MPTRMIDRPLRPLFPDGMRNDVQVIAMPLSIELDNLPDTLAIVAASAALTIPADRRASRACAQA